MSCSVRAEEPANGLVRFFPPAVLRALSTERRRNVSRRLVRRRGRPDGTMVCAFRSDRAADRASVPAPISPSASFPRRSMPHRESARMRRPARLRARQGGTTGNVSLWARAAAQDSARARTSRSASHPRRSIRPRPDARTNPHVRRKGLRAGTTETVSRWVRAARQVSARARICRSAWTALPSTTPRPSARR